MAFGRMKLTQDERMVVRLRTHARALVLPITLLVLFIGITVSLLRFYPRTWSPIVDWVTIGLAVVMTIVFCLVPFLRWRSTTYTITTKRIIARHGVLTRRGHDLPLSRVNDVAYERSLFDRLFGCGTLVLTTASEKPVRLPDVPHVMDVNDILGDLILRAQRPEVGHDDRD